MGNTLANLNSAELSALLHRLQFVMTKNAKLIFQIVNFSVIPKLSNHVLNVYENERAFIKRFYTNENEKILFNIEFYDKEKNIRKTLSTEIFHHTKEFFAEQFNQSGVDAKFYVGIDLQEFIPS